jgi:glutamine synthetase
MSKLSEAAASSDKHTGQTGNIYDALANFKKADWINTLLGEDVKGRYADLKEASADRCPRTLGTFIKAQEVQFHHEVYNQFLWNLF